MSPLAAWLIVILGYLLLLDPRLALVTFSLLPVLGLLTLYFRVRLRQNFRAVQRAIARINAFLQERLSGIEVIHAFGREARAEEQFEDRNRSHARAHLDSVFNLGLFFPLVEFIAVVSIALSLGIGGRWFAAGEQGVHEVGPDEPRSACHQAPHRCSSPSRPAAGASRRPESPGRLPAAPGPGEEAGAGGPLPSSAGESVSRS